MDKKHITILLVDDHELIRHGLQYMLDLEDDMEVVGNCANAEEAFSQVTKLSPDIVLMDTHMPGMTGIEATRCLKRNGRYCNAYVIILAESTDYLVEALEAGAAGYLLKNITRGELTEGIRQVRQSELPLEKDDSSIEEAVELVIPPPADAIQTLQFINQVETRLHASILQTVGSWDCGTAITVLLKPDPSSNLLDKLVNMPNVEKVEEERLAETGSHGFLNRFRTILRLRTSPRKRISITLS